jgi:hypothetical protein
VQINKLMTPARCLEAATGGPAVGVIPTPKLSNRLPHLLPVILSGMKKLAQPITASGILTQNHLVIKENISRAEETPPLICGCLPRKFHLE